MPSTLAFKNKDILILHPLKIKQINLQFNGLSGKREFRKVLLLSIILPSLNNGGQRIVRKESPASGLLCPATPFLAP